MNFDKESKSEKNGGVEGGDGTGGNIENKTVSQTVKRGKRQTGTIYTIESIWYNQHFKICQQLLKYKPYNSNFELCSK